MQPTTRANVRIIGCGRWLRRDDQVGLIVARELAKTTPPGVECIGTEEPAVEVLQGLDAVDLLVLVDAARCGPGVAAGTWRRYEYPKQAPRIRLRSANDTHTLGAELALALADEMGALPADVWVYAVAAGDFGYGEHLTPSVDAAVPKLVRAVAKDIRAWQARPESCRA